MTVGGADPGFDSEMLRWSADWSADEAGEPTAGPTPAERRRIRRRARWHGWGLWAVTALEVVVSIAVLAWVVRLAVTEPSLIHQVLVVVVVTIMAAAHGVTLWNRRGTWRPETRSIRSFAELQVLRQTRQLRSATRILPVFLCFQLALLVPWRIWKHSAEGHLDLEHIGRLAIAVATATAFVLIVCWIWAQVARRRLREAEAILDAMIPEPSPPKL